MSSGDDSSKGQKDVDSQGPILNFESMHNVGAIYVPKNVNRKENLTQPQDHEMMELHSRVEAQEKEMLYLREQIALESLRQSELLNEKYALEKTFSELRLALDEKQSEVITSASNELARRKGDLEVNLNLLNELNVTENEKHIFTSSMLETMAEFGALPHATNASALTSSIKHLHDKLQLNIRTSHVKLAELNSMIGNRANKETLGLGPIGSQNPSSSMGVQGFYQYNHYADNKTSDYAPRYILDEGSKEVQRFRQTVEMSHLPNNEIPLRGLELVYAAVNLLGAKNARIKEHLFIDFGNHAENLLERNELFPGFEQRTGDHFSQQPVVHDMADSFHSEGLAPEEGPGIDHFQITGEAKPGCEILGCGYPTGGTSLCMFQWVRHCPDGTREYIEGATYPTYVLTADDVDKLIAVECIPMDEHGRQGDLVRMFANDNKKIACDDEMQEEIDSCISKGSATFSVLILLDSPKNWELANLVLRRSGFQVMVEKKQDATISEKYSKDLLIKIPSGFSTQFVITCSNGLLYPFSTNNDVRMRDTLVLTMRLFQSKALDDGRKAKA